jgi:hypothetical protein
MPPESANHRSDERRHFGNEEQLSLPDNTIKTVDIGNTTTMGKGVLPIVVFGDVKALIDTGAEDDVTTRGFADARDLPLIDLTETTRIIMADKANAVPVTQRAQIELKWDLEPLANIKPLILEAKARNDFDVIIGRPTQRRLGINILVNKITMSREEGDIVLLKEKEDTESVKVIDDDVRGITKGSIAEERSQNRGTRRAERVDEKTQAQKLAFCKRNKVPVFVVTASDESKTSTIKFMGKELKVQGSIPTEDVTRETEDRIYARKELEKASKLKWEPGMYGFIQALIDELPGIATEGIRLAVARDGFQMPSARINLKPGAKGKLPNHTPQRLNSTMLGKLQEVLEPMKRAGILKESTSPYASRALLLPKTNRPPGEFRLVVDFRELNAQIERDSFAIPRISSCLSKLAGKKIFSKLDFKSWFHQIPLDKASQELTAFVTQVGSFTYQGLPQGLKISANFAQAVLSHIFALPDEEGSFHSILTFYVDDLCIFSENKAQHENHIKRVLHRLHKFGVQLNVAKCEWGVKKFAFLGHVVDAETDQQRTLIKPNERIVRDILDFPRPYNQRECQRLMGLINWFHEIIPKCAVICAPLTTLAAFEWESDQVWNEDAQRAFDEIKEALSSEPVVALPDDKKQYTLRMDASAAAFGGALLQKGEDDKMHPTLYISRKFNKAELNWSAGEKELYGLVFVIRRYGYLFYGQEQPLIYQNDHKPLQHWDAWTITPKLARWIEDLSSVDWAFEYIPGAENGGADCLSRPSDIDESETSVHKNKLPENIMALVNTVSVEELPKEDLDRYRNIFMCAVSDADFDDKAEEQSRARAAIRILHEPDVHTIEEAEVDVGAEAENACVCCATNALSSFNEVMPWCNSCEIDDTKVNIVEMNRVPSNIDEHVQDMINMAREQRPKGYGIGNEVKETREGRDVIAQRQFQGKMPRINTPDEAWFNDLEKAYREDPEQMMAKVKANEDRNYVIAGNGFIFTYGVKEEDPRALYIPRQASHLWGPLMKAGHEDRWAGGHVSATKTYLKIRRDYEWRGMMKDIEKFVRECDACQRTKPTTKRNYLPKGYPPPSHCFEVIAIDEKTDLPETSAGHTSIYVIMDYLSRRIILQPAKRSMKSEDLVVLFNKRVISQWGHPRKIVSDRGNEFTSRAWAALCQVTGVERNLASVGNPKTTALAERAIRSTLEPLRKYISEQLIKEKEWDLLLPSVEFAYNDSVHPRIAPYTPFEVSTGRAPRVPIEITVNSFRPPGMDAFNPLSVKQGHEKYYGSTFDRAKSEHTVEEFLTRCARIVDEARKQFQRLAEQQLNDARKKFKHAFPFQLGDKVLFSTTSIKDNSMKPPAFAKRKYGPFTVIGIGLGHTYKLDPLSCPDWDKLEEHEKTHLLGKLGPSKLQSEGKNISVNGELLTRYYDKEDILDWELDILEESPDLTSEERVLVNSISNLIVGNGILRKGRGYRRRRRTIRVLDLCSGTESLRKAIEMMCKDSDVEIEYTSWDYDPSMKALIQGDLKHWRDVIETLKPDVRERFKVKRYFDIAWFSPGCESRSAANTTGVRDLEGSYNLVKAGVELIKQTQPKTIFMENPESSKFRLRDEEFMKEIERELGIVPHSTTYCSYGFGYMKPTTIWSSVPIELMNCRATPCPARKRFGRHLYTAPAGPAGDKPGSCPPLSN